MARNYAQVGGSSTFRFPSSDIYNVEPGGTIPIVSGQPCFLDAGSIYIPAVILTDPDENGYVSLSTRGTLTVPNNDFGDVPVAGKNAYLDITGDGWTTGSGWGNFGLIIDVNADWVQISVGQFGQS